MKYQALRPHFFSVVGWGIMGWGGVVGLDGGGGGGGGWVWCGGVGGGVGWGG